MPPTRNAYTKTNNASASYLTCIEDSVGYRYGFNGQEKDDEITGVEGSHNTALFWEYDTRLGRRWNRDPKHNPSISEYAVFANNPIRWKDILGDTLTLGGNVDAAFKDILDLVPKEYQPYIHLSNSNKIIIDVNSPQDMFSYLGVELINNLVKSENNYKYVVGNKVLVRDYDGKEGEVSTVNPTTLNQAIANYSETPYYHDEPEAQYLPESGFNGLVRISEGSFGIKANFVGSGGYITEVPRQNLVFHELLENYFRTETTLPQVEGYKYAPNGGMYYSSSSTSVNGGAHQRSSELGVKFATQLGISTSGAKAKGVFIFKPNE